MKQYLSDRVSRAIAAVGLPGSPAAQFEKPRQADHGDLTTNIAMVLAKELKRKPRDIAQEIVNRLDCDPTLVEAVELAGPGFINFRFTKKYYY
jgi:arginyl-tRNA synthetase